MHEAGLVNDLIHKIEALASADGAKKVTGIEVWLGALSHISAGHFEEHFVQAAAGTIAEGAALSVQTSTDIEDPRAQEILLRSIDVET